MKARRREKASLDALDDLVAHLDGLAPGAHGGAGGERRLAAVRREPRAGRSPAAPRGGVTTPFGRIGGGRPDPAGCERRVAGRVRGRSAVLARLDHSQRLRDMSEAANRSLVAFYPVNAEGLGVSAAAQAASRKRRDRQRRCHRQPAVPGRQHRRRRDAAARPIAAAWPDGSRPRARRTIWCAYRSSNTKLDGRFRALSARTTRPDVRAARAPRLSRPHARRAAERPRGPACARPDGIGGRAAAIAAAVLQNPAPRPGPAPTAARSGWWASWTRGCGANWCGRPT